MAGRKASAARRKPPTKASGTVEVPEAAPRGALPDFIPPELATLVDKAPDGDRWLHEIKFDGYRTAGHLRAERVRMRGGELSGGQRRCIPPRNQMGRPWPTGTPSGSAP